jgi:hypothetical protein
MKTYTIEFFLVVGGENHCHTFVSSGDRLRFRVKGTNLCMFKSCFKQSCDTYNVFSISCFTLDKREMTEYDESWGFTRINLGEEKVKAQSAEEALRIVGETLNEIS